MTKLLEMRPLTLPAAGLLLCARLAEDID